MKFKVGQKVVCVIPHSHRSPGDILEKDGIYTIKEIFICSCGDVSFSVGLSTKDYSIKNSICSVCSNIVCKSHLTHRSIRFRPIQYNSATTKLANEFIEVKETSDMPIKQTEPVKQN